MWSLITSLLVILETRNYAMAGDLCPLPDLTGNAYEIVDTSPNKATVKITISPHTNTNNGWSTMLIFGTPLAADIQVSSYSVQISAISDDRKALTVESRDHNTDISKRRKYSFTLIFEGTDLDTQFDYFPALVGFYPELIGDGSCFLRPDVIITLPTTTSSSTTSSTTTTSPVTTTTSTTTSAATTTTSTTTNPDTTTTSTTTSPATTTTSTTITSPPVTQDLDFSITNPGWNNGGSWYFQFGYETPIGNYNDWTIKIVFSEEVVEITPYEADPDGPHSDGLVWFLTPKTWNNDISNGKVYGTATAITTADSAPCALAIFYNNNDTPDPSVVSIPGCGSPVTPSTTTSTTTTITTTTTTSTASTSTGSTSTISTASTSSTTASTLSPDGPTGILPDSSSQTIPDFTPSPEFVSGQSSFDYNEILHKSILFYEAQRSGPLPADNRILWRGDSGLKDGCVGGTCFVDLTGGWYDAGDFVKFGFPMAWSTTVLAWGMLEFEAAYQDAGEWNNALSMLKWATDYFLKAHTSQNELYFQVGDPDADHSSWGHPETMTMERPIYKIDTNNPGSEVAAETAAAMAASSLIFRSSDNAYADILLAHARDLYFFAQVYKGNYHETVSSSKVANFYRSFSGYRDELMWAAMWLYKATDEQSFLNDAISEFDAVGTSEFSWDQKGPGALVLLAQEDSQYKLKLDNALNSIMAKTRTPGGLTYFSEWGTNRYAANYALIALATAKMEGLETTEGAEHFGYGEEQIGKLLGDGDGSRSYVVGYGVNPPQRPHHRSSSCRSWSPTTSNECDWNDYNANGANPQILYGALVGGPEQDGSYTDDRGNFRTNEVAVDYNAGFQSAIAALKYFEVMARS